MTDMFLESEEDIIQWEDYVAEKKQKKLDNIKSSTNILAEHDVYHVIRNEGLHIMVCDQSKTPRIDFWPSTGKWIDRNGKMEGRGVFNLLRYIKK